jgi:hypothetical protein
MRMKTNQGESSSRTFITSTDRGNTEPFLLGKIKIAKYHIHRWVVRYTECTEKNKNDALQYSKIKIN